MEIESGHHGQAGRTGALSVQDSSVSSWRAVVGNSNGISLLTRRPSSDAVLQETWPNIHNGHEVKHVDIDHSGVRFATCAKDGVVNVGSLDSGRVLFSAPDPLRNGIANSVRFIPSANDEALLVASSHGRIRRVRLEGSESLFLHGHGSEHVLRAVPMSADICASCSTDRTARINDARDPAGEGGGVVFKHPGWVYDVAVGANDSLVVSACRDSCAYLWDCRRPAEPLQVLGGFRLSVTCCDISENGRVIVAGSVDNSIRVWSDEGELLHHNIPSTIRTGGVSSVSLSRDRQLLLVTGFNGGYTFFDLAKEQRDRARMVTNAKRLPVVITDVVTPFLW